MTESRLVLALRLAWLGTSKVQAAPTTQAQAGGLREGVKATKKVYFAENLHCVFRQEQGSN